MSEIADEAVKNSLTLNSTIAFNNVVNAMNSDVAMCQNSTVYWPLGV